MIWNSLLSSLKSSNWGDREVGNALCKLQNDFTLSLTLAKHIAHMYHSLPAGVVQLERNYQNYMATS